MLSLIQRQAKCCPLASLTASIRALTKQWTQPLVQKRGKSSHVGIYYKREGAAEDDPFEVIEKNVPEEVDEVRGGLPFTLKDVLRKPEKPKKPFDFFKEHIKQQLSQTDESGSRDEVRSKAANEWHQMSDSRKKPFLDNAVADMTRYKIQYEKYKKLMNTQVTVGQMVALIEGDQIKSRRKTTDDGTRIKKGLNSYFLFVSESHASQEAKGLRPKGPKEQALQWRALSEEQKQVFKDRAKANDLKYRQEMDELQKVNSTIEGVS